MMKRLLFMIFILNILFHIPSEGKELFLTDEVGRKVRIPHSPNRVISLAPSITEILFAMGLDQKIAGVTSFCDYPNAALSKPKIGGFINPSIEKIISLRPDLIIGIRDGNRKETIIRLTDLGFSVYVVNPMSFDGVIKTMKNIGEITGRQVESMGIVMDMMNKKNHIVSLTRSLPKPKVFFQVGDDPIITVGRGTLADDLVHFAGGRSISEDETRSYPLYSIETILLKAPEIIVISSMRGQKHSHDLMKKWQNWKNIPAVKMNSIYIVDSNLVDRPTPRIVEGLDVICRMIHPEIF
jgi:iron complex transport system substrate-binding protein